MVQKINPHPARGCNRSPPYYVFSKDAILGSVPSISSEVLASVQCTEVKKGEINYSEILLFQPSLGYF